ncbi:hypothetical protein M527_13730 [Sphingobium indicum IP26]|nr:hypothetical protein M527_13730 [Sphingobium indicum IP26]
MVQRYSCASVDHSRIKPSRIDTLNGNLPDLIAR